MFNNVQYSTEPVGRFRIALGRLRGSSSTGRKAFRCGVMARLWSVRFSATTHGLPLYRRPQKCWRKWEKSWWKGLTHGENFGEKMFHGAIGFFARLQILSWFPASESLRYAKACGGVPAVGTFLVAVALSEASDPITVTVTFFVRGD